MRELLEDCQNKGWQPALERAAQKTSHPLRFLEHAVSPCRAAWWPLLNLRPRSRVLELGCGWGAITFSLAPYVSCVLACSLNLEQLRFIHMRAAQDGATNVKLLCCGDMPTLPFADGAFDLVILNGILEWLPASLSGLPAAVQRVFLREVGRILATDGQLLLAASNTCNLHRVRNSQTGAARLMAADLSTAIAADQDKKPATHSSFGYKRLLRSAGFSSTSMWVPQPDLHTFHALLDTSRKKTVKRYFAERECGLFEPLRLNIKSSLAPLLATSFCWIADRRNARKSFLDSLGLEIAGALFPERKPRVECAKFRVTRREMITCELQIVEDSPNVILKIPLSARAHLRADLEHDTLCSLRERLQASGEWPEIPRPLLRGEFRNVPYYVQEGLPGFPGLRFLHSPAYSKKCTQLATGFVFRLHRATRTPVEFNETVWAQAILPLVQSTLGFVEQRAGIAAARLRDYILEALEGHTLPLVFGHGDYWPGNLLFDAKAQRLLGVIDWDAAMPRSLPLIDFLDLILSARAEAEGARATDLIAAMLRDGLRRDEAEAVERYLQAMGFSLSTQQLRSFLLLDWLLRVSKRVSSRQSTWWCEYQWLKENVDPCRSWLKPLVGEFARA